MQRTTDIQTRLSLPEFRELVFNMSPTELRKLPINRLPYKVPIELVKNAPPDSRGIIEHLLFEANRHELSLYTQIERTFGSEVMDALLQSDKPQHAALNRIFKEKVEELNALNREWQNDKFSTLDSHLLEMIAEIDTRLEDVRRDSMVTIKAFNRLAELLPKAGQYKERFKIAIAGLKKQFAYIDKWLGEYFLIRLMLVGLEMQKTKHRVESLEIKASQIQAQIDAINDQLTQSHANWKLKLAPSRKRQRVEKLQDDMSQLMREKNSCEVMIYEHDLRKWLDVIVDVSLSPFSRVRAEKSCDRLRLILFNLLNKYCATQEEAALYIARNPFVQTDAEKAIKFMLASEKYILNYFAVKRKEIFAWLGSTAKMKLATLEELEKQLLSEMRSNAL